MEGRHLLMICGQSSDTVVGGNRDRRSSQGKQGNQHGQTSHSRHGPSSFDVFSGSNLVNMCKVKGRREDSISSAERLTASGTKLEFTPLSPRKVIQSRHVSFSYRDKISVEHCFTAMDLCDLSLCQM